MRAHASLRLGSLRGTTPELLVSPWYCAWDFCVVWEAGRPHKTSSPPTQRRNGRAFSSLTARGGGLPVGVIRQTTIIKVCVAVSTLIALTGGFRVIKAALDDLLGLTRGARDAVGPAQLADGLITLHIIDQILDINLHRWTPVWDQGRGWHSYTSPSNSTTLE